MSKHKHAQLQLRFEGQVAVLTMHRPECRNAFGTPMREALYQRLLELSENEECRAIVLTGSGGHFTGGGDVNELGQREIIPARNRVELLTRIFRQIVTGPKPFLCAVEGDCMGAGVSFVAASDYAVASDQARFGCAFIKVGLMPDLGAIWSLPRKIGYRKAMELAAFGEHFSASAADAMDLLNGTVPAGDALAATIEVAQRFARNPPVAMAMLRAAMNSGNSSVDEACRTEIEAQSVLMHTADHAEAAQAFLEKRKPVFTGK